MNAVRWSVLLLVLAIISCPTARAATAPNHVVVVVLENHSYSEIIGSTNAPYITSLAQQGALFTQSFAATHPSQPNYLLLYSGSTQGVVDDTSPPPGAPYTTANLGAALLQSGHTFIGYSEGLPSVGYTGAQSGNYVRRHAPWVSWQGAAANAVPTTASQLFSAFPSDFTTLPTVAFVIPDLIHDMHDGGDPASIVNGDQWLQTHLDAYAQWAKTHDSLLLVTFDEDDGSEGNRIVTIFVGAMITPGTYAQVIGHRDVLRTIEAMYGLAPSGTGGASITVAGLGGSTAGGGGGPGYGSSSRGKRCGFSGGLTVVLAITWLSKRRRGFDQQIRG